MYMQISHIYIYVYIDICKFRRFQQVASEYEQIKSAGIDPQVAELAEYHGLGPGGTPRTSWYLILTLNPKP